MFGRDRGVASCWTPELPKNGTSAKLTPSAQCFLFPILICFVVVANMEGDDVFDTLLCSDRDDIVSQHAQDGILGLCKLVEIMHVLPSCNL